MSEANSDVNDLIQQASKEFQSALGSSEGGWLSVSVPVQIMSVDAGGQRVKTQFNASGERQAFEGYAKTTET